VLSPRIATYDDGESVAGLGDPVQAVIADNHLSEDLPAHPGSVVCFNSTAVSNQCVAILAFREETVGVFLLFDLGCLDGHDLIRADLFASPSGQLQRDSCPSVVNDRSGTAHLGSAARCVNNDRVFGVTDTRQKDNDE